MKNLEIIENTVNIKKKFFFGENVNKYKIFYEIWHILRNFEKIM